jgi:hypothetical protein
MPRCMCDVTSARASDASTPPSSMPALPRDSLSHKRACNSCTDNQDIASGRTAGHRSARAVAKASGSCARRLGRRRLWSRGESHVSGDGVFGGREIFTISPPLPSFPDCADPGRSRRRGSHLQVQRSCDPFQTERSNAPQSAAGDRAILSLLLRQAD